MDNFLIGTKWALYPWPYPPPTLMRQGSAIKARAQWNVGE